MKRIAFLLVAVATLSSVIAYLVPASGRQLRIPPQST
jgi:hypothetical protein